MQDKNYKIPAWMACEDLFNRLKTELVTEAMDALQEAMRLRLIEVNGSLITLPDKPSDTKMNMFIIKKLLQEKDRILEMYGSNFSNDDGKQMDAARLKQKERIGKFLLYVEKISLLMDYSGAVEAWMNDINKEITEKDPSKIIKRTLAKEESRAKLLDYLLKSRTIEKEEVITEAERSLLLGAMGR